MAVVAGVLLDHVDETHRSEHGLRRAGCRCRRAAASPRLGGRVRSRHCQVSNASATDACRRRRSRRRRCRRSRRGRVSSGSTEHAAEPVPLHVGHVPHQAEQRHRRRRHRPFAELVVGEAVALHGEGLAVNRSQASSISRSGSWNPGDSRGSSIVSVSPSLRGVMHDAELFTVGPDEVVVTFRTDDEREVETRVGDKRVVTFGVYHSARVTGLEPATTYPLSVDGDRTVRAAARRGDDARSARGRATSRPSRPSTTCTSARPSAGCSGHPRNSGRSSASTRARSRTPR